MRTTVIYAPHPDDETLYLAGYVRAATIRGDRMLLVAVTDGGSSGAKPTHWSVADLCRVRAAEQTRAWEALTEGTGKVIRMEQIDGSINAARVQALAEGLEDIYGTDVEHYVGGSNLTSQSADHRAVAQGVAAAGVRVVRYSYVPGTTSGGSLYKPTTTTECDEAWDAYRAFGHRSVQSMFDTLKASGYASRIFA